MSDYKEDLYERLRDLKQAVKYIHACNLEGVLETGVADVIAANRNPPSAERPNLPGERRTIQEVLQLHVDSAESMCGIYRRTGDSLLSFQQGMVAGLQRAIEVADYRDAHQEHPNLGESQGNSEERAFRQALQSGPEVWYPCGCKASAGAPRYCPEHGQNPEPKARNLGELREQLAKLIHHKLAAAQNLPYEDGDTCVDCYDSVDSEFLPIIEQREREAAEGIAKQACHVAENHYGYACLELRNPWDRLAKLKSQPKKGKPEGLNERQRDALSGFFERGISTQEAVDRAIKAGRPKVQAGEGSKS